MIYRPYAPDDFDRLYALEEACFEPPVRFDREYMCQLVSRWDAATWIAEVAGQMAGFAIVKWAAGRSGVRAYIETLEVAPDARRCGVGRELLSRIEGSARQAGARLIWLHVEEVNDAAIRLYEGQGYRCESREEDYYPMGRAALVYAKRLDAEAKSQRHPVC